MRVVTDIWDVSVVRPTLQMHSGGPDGSAAPVPVTLEDGGRSGLGDVAGVSLRL